MDISEGISVIHRRRDPCLRKQPAKCVRLAGQLGLALVFVGLAGDPATAEGWAPFPDTQLSKINPCTGQETTLALFDLLVLVSEPGKRQEGFKFRGRFETGDGFSGSLQDLDQANELADPDYTTFSQVVVFDGSNDAHQRVRFTSVLQVVIRNQELQNLGVGRRWAVRQHPVASSEFGGGRGLRPGG